MIHEVLKELGPKTLNWIYGQPQSSHNTGQNHQDPLIQHQGGKLLTKPNSPEEKTDKVH
jgi:hypothetical protein